MEKKFIAVKFYYPRLSHSISQKYNFVKDVGFSNYFVTVRRVNQIRTTRLFWSEKQFCIIKILFFTFLGEGCCFYDTLDF